MSHNEWILGHFICVCAVWTLLFSVHMACCHGHAVTLPDATVLELWSTGEHQGLPTSARPAPTCQGLSFSFSSPPSPHTYNLVHSGPQGGRSYSSWLYLFRKRDAPEGIKGRQVSCWDLLDNWPSGQIR